MHPIGVVAQRTGLNPDVIRVWERRYGAVHPARGPGGQRVYTDADVERLRLLRLASDAGRPIGQVARLDTAELARLVDADEAARSRLAPPPDIPDAGEAVERALALTRALDGPGLDQTLRRTAVAGGLVAFFESVAAPLLRRIGEEWHAGRLSVAQEHLASSVLHDLAVETLRSFGRAGAARRLVAGTLSGERHVIGAAAVGAAAALEGWGVVYLGADVPVADLAAAARSTGAAVVAVSMVHVDDRRRTAAELRRLAADVPPETAVWAGGSGAVHLAAELAELGVQTGTLGELAAELRRRS